MTAKRKITDKNGVQVFPITHTKAVLDDNGNSVEQRLQELANAPDEEDLTSFNTEGISVYKFKDKPYNPLVYSGIGRKYIRKNIIDNKNILTQAMVNTTNTIYHIQYDYDLNGQTITLPDGCVLKFDGGSLSNGTIIGNGTTIEAQTVRIFQDTLKLDGTFKIDAFYVEWYGGSADGITINNIPFQLTCDAVINIGIPIQLLAGTYIIDEGGGIPLILINFAGNGQKFIMKGKGMGVTILKTADGSLDRFVDRGGNPKWRHTFYITPSDGRAVNASYDAECVIVSDLTFDKNKWANSVEPASSYAWESNSYFEIGDDRSGLLGIIKNVVFENIEIKNKVGSCLKMVNPTIRERVVFNNIVSHDEKNPWGDREDIYPLAVCPEIIISNCRCHFVQTEAVASQAAKRDGQEIHVTVSNCIFERFEWLETLALPTEPAKKTMLISDSTLGTIGGTCGITSTFNNCIFRLGDKIESTIWSGAKFNSCDFYFHWTEDNVLNKVQARAINGTKPFTVWFNRCNFITENSLDTEESVNASILDCYTVSSTPPIMKFTECNFDVSIGNTAGTRLFNSGRGHGWFDIERCRINVNENAKLVGIGTFQSGFTKLIFKDNDVVNNNQIAIVSTVYQDAQGNPNFGIVEGTYNRADLFVRASGEAVRVFPMNGDNLHVTVDDKATLVTNLLIPKGTNITCNGIRYKFRVDKPDKTANTWDMYTGEFVNKFMTSAERLALDSLPPIPLECFDTTLNKPIYWTGTAWVDSNGNQI